MKSRSAGIDVLRGLLALWVLFVHTVPWANLVQGENATPAIISWLVASITKLLQPHAELNPAVLAFIVLSGYCIRKSFISNSNWTNYWVRRVFRILPIFLLGTVAGIAGFSIAKSLSPTALVISGTANIDIACVAAKLSTIAALVPTFHSCTFAGNAPLLTVMVELSLYAVFPLLMPRSKLTTLIVCGSSLGAGLIVSLFNLKYPVIYNWWQNSSLYGFIPYWWIGAAFAARPAIGTSRAGTLIVAWLALTVICYADPTGFTSEIRKIVFAILIGLAIVKIDSTDLRNNLFSTIGLSGYSLYALHAPIVYLMLILGVTWWICALCAIGCGLASFYVFERPLDLAGRSISTKLDNRRSVHTQRLERQV
jgi:peptidoglycan/LPS O-acetylase OafA/YrhL